MQLVLTGLPQGHLSDLLKQKLRLSVTGLHGLLKEWQFIIHTRTHNTRKHDYYYYYHY